MLPLRPPEGLKCGDILLGLHTSVSCRVGGGCSAETLKEEVFRGIFARASAEGEKQQQKCRGGK